jgi:hypothetical protein
LRRPGPRSSIDRGVSDATANFNRAANDPAARAGQPNPSAWAPTVKPRKSILALRAARPADPSTRRPTAARRAGQGRPGRSAIDPMGAGIRTGAGPVAMFHALLG